jgi:hypothetical protein
VTIARTKLRPPGKQVASFIATFEPAVARVARSARATLRRRFPTAVELVYDNYNALAIGWSATERSSDVIVSLAIYAGGVNLYFMQGARLADPGGLLEGGGRQGRFVRLPENAVLAQPDVVALLKAAEATGRTPLPSSGRGYTVIKSVSARQRPRRR